MSEKRKVRIGIIFGGRSGEHEVSLQSAQSVMAALNPERYEVVPIGITPDGRWLIGDVVGALTAGNPAQSAALLPDPTHAALMQITEEAATALARASFSAVTELDVIFPVLHGTYGEDGTVQGLLELAGLPYVGAGVTGSAVGMDKGIFKQVMVANGLPLLPYKLYNKSLWLKRPNFILDDIEISLTYPVFTKPANLGSSVGVCKCNNRTELVAGLDEAATYDRRIVVEQGLVHPRELEVSVLGNDDPIASVVGEVRPHRDFYDYVAKYVSDDSDLMIPAELAAEKADELRALAIKAYIAIDCAGLGRVDFLMDRENGRLYINEINTLPGFTNISMYPKLWEATGVSYSDLLDRLVALAIERNEEKRNLRTSFVVTE